jgi:hypothetical protein
MEILLFVFQFAFLVQDLLHLQVATRFDYLRLFMTILDYF